MSEEEVEKPSAGEGGSVLRKWGPLAVIVLVAQATLAWVVISTFFKGRGDEDHAAEALLPADTELKEGGSKEEHAGELPEYFKDPVLKKILANPAGTDASRVVMVSVELGLTQINPKAPKSDEKPGGEGEGEVNPDFKPLAPFVGKMKALIVELVSSKGIDELLDPEGKNALKEEIKKKLNNQIVSRVYKPDPEDDEKKIFEVTEVIFPEFVIQ